MLPETQWKKLLAVGFLLACAFSAPHTMRAQKDHIVIEVGSGLRQQVVEPGNVIEWFKDGTQPVTPVPVWFDAGSSPCDGTYDPKKTGQCKIALAAVSKTPYPYHYCEDFSSSCDGQEVTHLVRVRTSKSEDLFYTSGTVQLGLTGKSAPEKDEVNHFVSDKEEVHWRDGAHIGKPYPVNFNGQVRPCNSSQAQGECLIAATSTEQEASYVLCPPNLPCTNDPTLHILPSTGSNNSNHTAKSWWLGGIILAGLALVTFYFGLARIRKVGRDD